MKIMKKIIWILIVVLVVLLFVIYFVFFSKPKPAVVLISNGDIYVGYLKVTPSSLILKSPWILQNQFNQQTGQIERGFLRWKNTIWQPNDFIVFNRNNVVFWSYISKESNLLKGIEQNKETGFLPIQIQTPQQPQPQTQQPQPQQQQK
jgi:hypothetical protein